MTEVFKTTSLSDEITWFFQAALKGRIHDYDEESRYSPIGSLETSISRGLSDGFSPQDIACFYIAREIGTDWPEILLENLSEDFRKRVDVAFEEFQKNSQLEINCYREALRNDKG